MKIDKNDQLITIPLSTPKLTLMALGALAFVALGVWFVFDPSKFDHGLPIRHILVIVVGGAAVIFFGLGAVFIGLKLTENKPGLLIDKRGMLDNTSIISDRFIPWDDVDALNVLQIGRQKLIMIYVSNPESYITQQTNYFKRKALQLNFKQYGTPLSITSASLKCNFDELYQLLNEKLEENRATIL